MLDENVLEYNKFYFINLNEVSCLAVRYAALRKINKIDELKEIERPKERKKKKMQSIFCADLQIVKVS